MSAAFVPTFTRHLTRAAATRPGGSATSSSTRCSSSRASSSLLGIVFAEPLHALLRDASSPRSRQARADDAADADHAAVPDAVAVAAALMGMLNSLHRFFIPALSPAMFNVATIVCALLLVPVMPRVGSAADRRDRDRHADRRPRADRGPVAGAAARGLSLPPDARLPRPGAAAGPAPDGPGHARPRGDADQRVRQHVLATDAAAGRGVVAELRVPADVPADRPLRRVDRDGGDAGHRAARGGARTWRRCGRRSRSGFG